MNQFQVGTTYDARSNGYTYPFEVVRRTDKSVWVRGLLINNRVIRRSVFMSNGVEQCNPDGKYSMSPVMSAEDVTNNPEAIEKHISRIRNQAPRAI